MAFDIIIQGGQIVDGLGNPAFPGDVALQGERIAAIGNLAGAEAGRRIDAAGKVVCPGFVDIHSHTDFTILADRAAISSLYQGVTTEIVGNCGLTFAPIAACSRDMMQATVASFCGGLCADWSSFGGFVQRVAEGAGVNLGLQVGHAPLRRAVLGGDAERPARPDEIAQMERLVAESLDGGAIGLSFGLEFMPGRVSEPEELRRLCAVAGSRHKMTSWHVRNRDRRFEEAVQEAIDVTRDAGAGLQLSHLSAKPGSSPRAWNRCMEAVRLARSRGQDIQCDMIPYTVGPGSMATILPNWATSGTTTEIQARLRDPATRERLKAESDRYWFLFYYRQWDRLTLTRNRVHPEWAGKTLREIGEIAGKDPFDIVYDILADEGDTMGQVWVNGVLFSEGDIIEWLTDPLFCIASDGLAAQVDGPTARQALHPASFGWTPRVIQTYVRELRAFSLETAVQKMTSMPAARFGLYDRGLLRAGAMADVVVFDPARFTTRATFLKPHVYAEGMDYVFINGQSALAQGKPTGALAGRVLGR